VKTTELSFLLHRVGATKKKEGDQGLGGIPGHSVKFLEHSASFSTMSSRYFKVFLSDLVGFGIWMTFRVES
jgi:hypothetical protein